MWEVLPMFLQQTVTVLMVAFKGQRRNLFDFGLGAEEECTIRRPHPTLLTNRTLSHIGAGAGYCSSGCFVLWDFYAGARWRAPGRSRCPEASPTVASSAPGASSRSMPEALNRSTAVERTCPTSMLVARSLRSFSTSVASSALGNSEAQSS